MKLKRLQYIISSISIIIVLVHIVWPKLTIDAITVTLLFIALIPWLAPLFKTLEFPGGWKIHFQDFERAQINAGRVGLLSNESELETINEYSFLHIADKDPKLALAGLRIEIEKRLKDIAESNNIRIEKAGIGRLLSVLNNNNLLSQEQRSVLADMINLLNTAVHGGEIDTRTAEWALEVGPRLLETLKNKKNVK